MKRIFSVLLAAVMLMGCMVITSSAAKADVEFSTKGSSGQPDDHVTYEVYCDSNVGTYSCGIDIGYDLNALKLVSCENGEIWAKSEYSTSKLSRKDPDNKQRGLFRYFAECKNPEDVNSKTGLMFTLTFEILKTAVNGDNEVKLSFPNDGNGWFIYDKGVADLVDLSVACTKQSAITVYGSDATAPVTDESNNDPEDSDNDVQSGDSTKAPSGGSNNSDKAPTPVYTYVTDDAGKLVRDEEGNYVTVEVTDTSKPVPQYKFDENGEPETDDEGDYVTYYDETTVDPESDGSNASTSGNKGNGNSTNSKLSSSTSIVLIISIAAVAVAAVIIIIVVAASKKKNSDVTDESDKDSSAEAEERSDDEKSDEE